MLIHVYVKNRNSHGPKLHWIWSIIGPSSLVALKTLFVAFYCGLSNIRLHILNPYITLQLITLLFNPYIFI